MRDATTDRDGGRWLPTFRGYERSWLLPDVVAGVAAGTVVIPQAMAYAALAGLPVEVGLYTCMLPMLAYAALGGSRTLSISTTSTIAMLTATVLAGLPGSSSGEGPEDLVRQAATLALLVGTCLVAMRLLRLGALVEQVSPATMTGVKWGVGLTVLVSQLPTLFGGASGEGSGFLRQLGHVVEQLPGLDPTTTLLSLAALALLLGLRRLAPRVPAPLVVVVGSIVLVAVTGIEDRGVALIDRVPPGLPLPVAPVLGDVFALLPGALAIAVMAFLETVLVARSQRSSGEPPIDSGQELLANGVAAFAGGLTQTLTPAGGFSQSAVNQRSGARTQLSGVVTALLAVLVAGFLGPVLDDLPRAVLAAMVVTAVLGLVIPAEFVLLWRVDRTEFWVATLTAVVGLTAGLLVAVLVGVVLTLVLVLRAINHSRARPTHGSADEAVGTSDAPLLLELTGPLYTGNARPTQDDVLRRALSARRRLVVLDCREVTQVTVPFLDTVRGLAEDLAADEMELVVTALPPPQVEAARALPWFRDFHDAGGVRPGPAAMSGATPGRDHDADRAGSPASGDATSSSGLDAEVHRRPGGGQ